MSETQTYNMRCKCGWAGPLAGSASDRCPRCSHRLRLAEKESRGIMRDAIKQTLTPDKPLDPAVVMSRSLRDKDAPKDEGEWEFKYSNGVLEVIAWNDDKTEAQCVRLARRGNQIYLMTSKPERQGDE